MTRLVRTYTCLVSVAVQAHARKSLHKCFHRYRLSQTSAVARFIPAHEGMQVAENDELDDNLSGIEGADGWMSVVGFGSLLSKKSAQYTFPNLRNFRIARIRGYRRVFAHVAPIFLIRGIARLESKEMSSLSVEPSEGSESLVVSLFEIERTPEAVAAWIDREHEFRFLAVQPYSLDGQPEKQLAVVCARFDEAEYRARRCSDEEFERRYGRYGVHEIWRDDILPCRVYLRHCVLAAKHLSPEAYDNFLDHTFLADRQTPIRVHLERNPDIMNELPPPELAERYCG